MKTGIRNNTIIVHRGCGREVTEKHLEQLKETRRLCPGLSRSELACTVCEYWEWLTASGNPKKTACLRLFEELESKGLVSLPQMRAWRNPKTKAGSGIGVVEHTCRTQRAPCLSGKFSDVSDVRLELVESRDEFDLWNEYMDRYHYLGYRKPIGCFLRYFINCQEGLLGCILLAGASRAIKGRDEWIGWTKRQRQCNLPWVINNTRFLTFEWVQIRHVASHSLALLAKRVGADWQNRWGYTPLLMETFVGGKYKGSSYRGAGWIDVGYTSARGLEREGHCYQSTRKRIYLKSLVENFRERPCEEQLVERTSL